MRDHLFSDKQYYILNSIAALILPAVGALYFGFAQIWGLPGGEQVVGSIVVVDTFLGVIIKVGEASYDRSEAKFAGSINVSEQPEKKVFSLDLKGHPDELLEKKKVTFKVEVASVPSRPVEVAPEDPPAPTPRRRKLRSR